MNHPPHGPALSLKDRCRAVSWLVLDVDGVLTAGEITYGEADELKSFHVRDGAALVRWHAAGQRSAILTGRRSPVVARRAAELGIAHVIQGAADKRAAFEALLAEQGLGASAVCYVGDDVFDVPVLRQAGLAVAPADAGPEARACAHYLTRAAGGRGAVAEVVALILETRNDER